MNGSVDEAKAALDALPLAAGGFMSFELMPLGRCGLHRLNRLQAACPFC